MSKNLYSLTLERRALGGLIKYPDIYNDIHSFIKYDDFYQSIHESIFIVTTQRIEKNLKCEATLISQDLKNIGIKSNSDIDIFDYIEGLTFSQISPDGAKEAFKEIHELKLKRDLAENLKKALDYVNSSADKSIDEVVTNTDSLYNQDINAILSSEKPVDIFSDIDLIVEERGNNPVNDIGYPTPFPCFNQFNGGLRPKNIYAIVARPGQGKSNWLMEMSFGTSLVNDFNVKVLYLDTENEQEDVRNRMLSSISGVPFWYLETGNWKNHAEYEPKIRKALKSIKDNKYTFHFYKVANKSIEQICSYARRWHSKNVGRGGKCILVYDYIKLTTEKVDKNWAEHQAIGDKIDKIKNLAGELNAVALVAMQLNKSGDSQNKKSHELNDDSSAVALSDRLQWFASYVGLLRPKTIDELEIDGPENGTHKLIKIKGRFQGKSATGHSDLVKRKINGKWLMLQNYINYNIDNFKLEERGTLRDILQDPRKSNITTHEEDPRDYSGKNKLL